MRMRQSCASLLPPLRRRPFRCTTCTAPRSVPVPMALPMLVGCMAMIVVPMLMGCMAMVVVSMIVSTVVVCIMVMMSMFVAMHTHQQDSHQHGDEPKLARSPHGARPRYFSPFLFLRHFQRTGCEPMAISSHFERSRVYQP